jgi:hypothetical protein
MMTSAETIALIAILVAELEQLALSAQRPCCTAESQHIRGRV